MATDRESLPVVRVTTSSVQNYWSCEQRYVYAHVQNIQPKAPPVPLKKGIWLHLLLAAEYQGRAAGRQGDWMKAQEHLVEQFLNLDVGVQEKYADLPSDCQRITEAYLWHYHTLHRALGYDDFEVLAIEKSYSFRVRRKDAPVIVELSATLDLVGRDRNGVIFSMEHKTGRDFPYNWNMIMLEPQGSLQLLALQQNGLDARYHVVNYLRNEPPGRAPINKDGSLSKRETSTDLKTFLMECRERGLDSKDPEYREYVHQLADPERSKYFRRVETARNDRVAKIAAINVAKAGPRIHELDQGAEAERRIGFRCNGCTFAPLCHAEIMGQNAGFIRETEYEPRQDDRDWLEKDE